MEPALGSRLLGHQVPPPLRRIPTHLPHHAHRLLHTVRAQVLLGPQRILQHAAKGAHAAVLRRTLHPRRQSERETIVRVDGQRGGHDEVVHQRGTRRRDYGRPEAVPGGLRRVGAGQEEPGRLVESVDGDRVDQLHGVHFWDHFLVEVQRYGQGEERAEESGGVSE